MKSIMLTMAVLILSSCAEYTEQVRQENIQRYRNQCLQSGLKEGTDALSQCLSLSIYKAQADENSRLAEANKLVMQQQQLEMIRRISLK